MVIQGTAKKFATAAQRNGKLVFAMEGPFSPVLTRRATANTIEPPILYSVLTVLARHNSQNVSQIFLVICAATQCVEPRMAGRPLLLPDS